MSKFENKILKCFMNKKNPNNIDINNLAKSFNISEEKLQTEIYSILSSFLYEGIYNTTYRKTKGISINKEELKKGIDVEMEHTSNRKIALRIALDHLTELSDYYTRLAKMKKE